MARPRVKTRAGLLFEGAADSPAERLAGKRHLKKGQILSLLRTHGPLSRIEIARTLGFNHRSVSLLLDDLIADNLVSEEQGRKTASGRRPIPVVLNPAAACVLGIDAGRTTTALAVMDLQGHLLFRVERESDFSSNADEQTEWVATFVTDFLAECKGNVPPLAGVGLSAEGLVFRQKSPDRLAAATEPTRKRLEAMLRVPVIADSDSRFLALGEQWFGAVKGTRDAVIFNLTDGLGLSCIVDGKLLRGSRGWAGEIGHVPLGETGIACYCGSSSCLENIVSGSGLLRMAAQRGIKLGRKATAESVAKLAREGSRPAMEVFERFAEGLALAVTITVDLFTPEAVILGGRISRNSDLYLDSVKTRLHSLVVPYIRKETVISGSELHEDAILLGTCAGVLNQIYDPAHVAFEALL